MLVLPDELDVADARHDDSGAGLRRSGADPGAARPALRVETQIAGAGGSC